ncbi:16S rRNA (adenine(1518)-N(6)/adenine(1519)-N(6))-dimethyltransferaseRsmA [soil metagenome]
MSSPAKRLAALGLSAKKSLGQHFLHDQAIVRRICDVASIPPNATVVEIGPGLGTLTIELAKHADSVIALEKDSDLAKALSHLMPGNVQVQNTDALEYDPSSIDGRDYYLVANLPYNVATAILRRFLDSTFPPRSCTFMVQREVADRMVTRPPEMNILGVAMQFHGHPRIAFRVGRGAFTPPPRVTSSVVHMPVQRRFDLDQSDLEGFFDMVRAGFSARRKQIKNSLENGGIPDDLVVPILESAGIDPASRPQELDVEDWIAMFQALQQIAPGDQR